MNKNQIEIDTALIVHSAKSNRRKIIQQRVTAVHTNAHAAATAEANAGLKKSRYQSLTTGFVAGVTMGAIIVWLL